MVRDSQVRSNVAINLLAVLGTIAACWLARDLLVPVLLAAFFALIVSPLVTLLRRIWIPRWLAAAVVVLGAMVLVGGLGSLMIEPAAGWIRKAPEELRQLAPKVRKLVGQVDQANRAAAAIANAAGAQLPSRDSAAAASDRPEAPNLWHAIFSAPRVLAGILAVVLLVYFFLLYGARLQRNAIALLPPGEQRGRAEAILRAIAADVSVYVVTISAINAVLGLLVAAALWALGLPLAEALLWGVLGALLNYIPYIGPLIGVILLGLVGIVAFDTPMQMLLPAAIYLGLQLAESEFLTPMILGRRMALSPLVILLWLLLLGFLWGVAGVLLAVPLLVTLKIIAERVERWRGWARVIE